MISQTKNEQPLLGLTGRRNWLILWLLWTAIGLLHAVRLYTVYNFRMQELWLSWPQAIVWSLIEWYIWGLLSLVIVRVCVWLPFDRKTWKRSLFLQIAAAVPIVLLHVVVWASLSRATSHWYYNKVTSFAGTYSDAILGGIVGRAQAGLLTYFLIAAAVYAIRHYRSLREREVHLASLQAQLAGARLETLKAQLHPHFLFNTLNAISSLIHTDPGQADYVIARLSDLLRTTLDSSASQQWTLRQELAFLDCYLDIQKCRFPDRLRVRQDIDPDTLDALVPTVALQPLVENAIRHGISHRVEGGELIIRGRRENTQLVLEVADDGPGFVNGNRDGSGKGIALTRDRLHQFFGENGSLTITQQRHNGVLASIRIPLIMDNRKCEDFADQQNGSPGSSADR
ncbi:MAG: histidine kinase [Candidatus Zixiibacteriota bacterium]